MSMHWYMTIDSLFCLDNFHKHLFAVIKYIYCIIFLSEHTCILCLFSHYSAISVELYYIFATLWGREQYTLYGILFIVYGILLSVTGCISVALTYFQLSAEDYRWWWRSIFSAGYTLTPSINLFCDHTPFLSKLCFVLLNLLKLNC